MKTFAKYQNYETNNATILALWQVLEEFSEKEISSFLFFVTGIRKKEGSYDEYKYNH